LPEGMGAQFLPAAALLGVLFQHELENRHEVVVEVGRLVDVCVEDVLEQLLEGGVVVGSVPAGHLLDEATEGVDVALD